MSGDEEANLTVRELVALLADIPEEYQDAPVYATYDGGCVTGLYELESDRGNVMIDEDEQCVIIRGD